MHPVVFHVLSQIENERRAATSRLRSFKEKSVMFPEHKDLFDDLIRELQAFLDVLNLKEKEAKALEPEVENHFLFEMKGESDNTPVRVTYVLPMGKA